MQKFIVEHRPGEGQEWVAVLNNGSCIWKAENADKAIEAAKAVEDNKEWHWLAFHIGVPQTA